MVKQSVERGRVVGSRTISIKIRRAIGPILPQLLEQTAARALSGDMQPATGCVVIEPDGRIWVVAPTNAHGGYKVTFPKGKNEDNLPLQANAIREVWEESGLRVRIAGLLGDFERTTSVTRYYLAERIGGSPADMGWESQSAGMIPVDRLTAVLTNPADKPIIKALVAALNKEA